MLAAPALTHTALAGLVTFLMLFFIAFQPAGGDAALAGVTPGASRHVKGFAMGVYNTTQAFGLFLGGIVGGRWPSGLAITWCFTCAALAAIWFVAAFSMQTATGKKRD